MTSYLKQPTFRSPAWLRAVAELPCVECGATDVQAAHCNEGKGMGIKVDDCLTAALCCQHHAEIDQGKGMSRDERRQRMEAAILKTLVQLSRTGKLRVCP